MSTQINVTVGDARLLQAAKTRAVANQQSLVSRQEDIALENAANEAAQEATPPEFPSASIASDLPKIPAAQRRSTEEEEEEEDEDPGGGGEGPDQPKFNYGKGFVGVSGLRLFPTNDRFDNVQWTGLRFIGGTTSEIFIGTNRYDITDDVFQPKFYFEDEKRLRFPIIKSSPAATYFNSIKLLDWTVRQRGYTVFNSGTELVVTIVNAEIPSFPIPFNSLQALTATTFPGSQVRFPNSLRSCSPLYIYITRVDTITTIPQERIAQLENPNYFDNVGEIDPTVAVTASTRVTPSNFTTPTIQKITYLRVPLTTQGPVEYKTVSLTPQEFSTKRREILYTNMYDDDPHKYLAEVRKEETGSYNSYDPELWWPSSLSYNPRTGVTQVIAKELPTSPAAYTLQKILPKNLNYKEVMLELVPARPFNLGSFKFAGFVEVSFFNIIDPFGERYEDLYPLLG
jgi:hypothetical protein